MAVITVYLDDSGTDPANPVACCAGFIGPMVQWKKFEKEWTAATLEPGDEFACMHMAECVSGNSKSEFATWTLKKKQRVLKRLRGIVKERASKCLGMAVSKEFYKNLVSDEIKSKTGDYFTYSVMLTLSIFGRWRRVQGIQEPVQYVFDWLEPNDPQRRQLEELFENECARGRALEDYGLVSGGYSFRHKEVVLPLQAADIAAWTLYNGIQEALAIKTVNQLAGESYVDLQTYRKEEKWFDAGYQNIDQMQDFIGRLPASPEFAAVRELIVRKKRR